MSTWRPQEYKKHGQLKGVDPDVLSNAIRIGDSIATTNPNLPPIFTLKHFSELVDVRYNYLRNIISRKHENPYRTFRIPKSDNVAKSRGFRVICVPDWPLLKTQQWITRNILAHVKPHHASFAFSKGSSIYCAAKLHCGCKWLIKLDVKNFFESISEINTYNIFRGFGYEPLLAFELGRICTRIGSQSNFYDRQCWVNRKFNAKILPIKAYFNHKIGHLPQGAPTSPMLSNLVMQPFDEKVLSIANQHDLIYTRYADDICLSTMNNHFSRKSASQVIGTIYSMLWEYGLSPNTTKTRVSPPGARKIVLGLIVNDKAPRLTRHFKSRLRQHFHYLLHQDFGPSKHAHKRGFDTVWGLRNYIQGLLAYAKQIEPDFAETYHQKMKKIEWPF